MKVLIAEDDAVSRRILEATLQRLGHECRAAEDGLAAWELYASFDPDVLVSDWMMPGIDGLELCRRVRAAQGRYCYVILLTALGRHADALAGTRAGADDYLTKPLRREELEIRLISAARVTALHERLADREAALELHAERLRVEARVDALTGLGNRLRLDEDIASLEARAIRYGHGFGVALCDLDNFKSYNDRHGHPAGDEVLRAVAGALVAATREGDVVYRYGGEEILVVLPGQGPPGVATVLERLRAAVEGLGIAHPDSRAGVVTISAGVAVHAAGETAGEVIERADVALYAAKAEGRNRVVVSSGDPAPLPLERHLAPAVERR